MWGEVGSFSEQLSRRVVGKKCAEPRGLAVITELRQLVGGACQ